MFSCIKKPLTTTSKRSKAGGKSAKLARPVIDLEVSSGVQVKDAPATIKEPRTGKRAFWPFTKCLQPHTTEEEHIPTPPSQEEKNSEDVDDQQLHNPAVETDETTDDESDLSTIEEADEGEAPATPQSPFVAWLASNAPAYQPPDGPAAHTQIYLGTFTPCLPKKPLSPWTVRWRNLKGRAKSRMYRLARIPLPDPKLEVSEHEAWEALRFAGSQTSRCLPRDA